MRYRFQARNGNGASVQGVVEADDRYEALAQLRDEHMMVKRLIPIRRITELLNTEISPSKLSVQTLSVLCTQCSILLEAGFSVPFCLNLLERQIDHHRLHKIFKKAGRLVEEGNSLADSFAMADRNAFPETFLETVRAGERAGTLEEGFRRLAAYYEKRYQRKQKAFTAMVYPAFVLVAALVVIGFVMIMVVPTLTGVFQELEAELPASTMVLIRISKWFRESWFSLIVCMLGVLVVGLWYVRTERGRLRYGRWLLRIPVYGKLHLLEMSGQFAHTMSVMLHSGLSLVQALQVTARTLENDRLADEVSGAAVRVLEGGGLGEWMRKTDCFPDILIEVCAAGEETGELEELLTAIGVYFDSQLEFASKRALSMLEPVLLVLLAAFVGFIVLSIYLPMFTMYELL